MSTIIALATPWGHSALAVVRLSGEQAHRVLRAIATPMSAGLLRANRPRRVRVHDADGVFDDGIVLLGEAPNTYTGEPTAELTVHGNPLVVERLMAAAVAAGARVAEPGEFTRRAVLNGKLDLVRAEAVVMASEARTAAGLAVARDAFDGRVGEFLARVRERLASVAAELEARLDYPADELALEADAALCDDLAAIATECAGLAATFDSGRVMVHGARVALVGAVNAGKSSLFNALLGRARALVHATEGTTRDVLEVPAVLGGVSVTLLDTAGERVTDDPVEAAGLALAAELVAEADLLVVVLRARSDGPSDAERRILERVAHRPHLVVYNGVDRPGMAPPPQGALPTVATQGQGVDALITELKRVLIGEEPGHAGLVIASARQRDRLLGVQRAATDAVTALPLAGPAVAAEAVVDAMAEIDAITGLDTREGVLDALFARFCIGK